MTRVVLVDDQPLARVGLRRILAANGAGLEVVGESDDGDEVVALVAATRPDVVVMDMKMKRVDGAEATERLRRAGDAPPVLVLTTFDDDETLSRALRAGAAGFVLKHAPAEDVIRAVQVVAAGGAWLDPAVTSRVLHTFRRSSPAPDPDAVQALTSREQDVLVLLARGATNAEIADGLGITVGTVKTHVSHILNKLALRDRSAAIVFAYETGVVGA